MNAFQLLWLKTISLMEFDWDSNSSSIQRPCSLCVCMYVQVYVLYVYIVCANVITCTDAAGHFDKCFAMWFWDGKRGSRGHRTLKRTRARERLVFGIFELFLVQSSTYQVAVSFPITDSLSCPRYGGISRPRQYRSSAIASTGSPAMTSSPGSRWRRCRRTMKVLESS